MPNLSTDGWIQGPATSAIRPNSIHLHRHGDPGIIIIHFSGEFTAFRNACAHQELPIHAGDLDRDGTLLCPWHSWCYDVRNGACQTIPGEQLKAVELRIVEEQIWLKV